MIIIDLPDELNRNIEMFKAKYGFDTKNDAIISALYKQFKLKAPIERIKDVK